VWIVLRAFRAALSLGVMSKVIYLHSCSDLRGRLLPSTREAQRMNSIVSEYVWSDVGRLVILKQSWHPDLIQIIAANVRRSQHLLPSTTPHNFVFDIQDVLKNSNPGGKSHRSHDYPKEAN
jgi:hypothetical protein